MSDNSIKTVEGYPRSGGIYYFTNQTMSTYNYLFTEITCPKCGSTDLTEVNLYFGNTIFMDTFSIGDIYKWLPHKSIKNGGRPENGDLDGEGYAACPHCHAGYYVKVLVRQDRITDVQTDTEKNNYMDALTKSEGQ